MGGDRRMTPLSSHCNCGHPWSHHEHVPGFEMSHGVTITNEDGTPTYTGPVWVCSGDHDPPDLGPDASPWDYACGCVLHSPPPLVVVP